MRVFAARRIRLNLTVPLTVMAVILAGTGRAAGSATTSIDVSLSARDVSVASGEGQSTIVVDPAAGVNGELSQLTDPGRPSIPFYIVRALLPDGHEFAGFDVSA
ncbi:MAG: hypothetical protein PVF33_00980, partial [Candidatus Latescibacterota bacterium]